MNIHNVEFIKSAASPNAFLSDGRPNIVFSGKSNVGKSSVINCLLNRKNFARVGAQPGKTVHIYTMEDNLIFEENQIKRYENSKQYIEDSNRYHLTKELEDTKRKNAELTTIANAKMNKDLELEVKGQKPDEYNKKLYLLKNMKWLQRSWWQENG